METPEEKYCKDCQTTKPATDFNKKSDSKDGLQNNCKLYRKNQLKKYYKKETTSSKGDEVVDELDLEEYDDFFKR
jgi:hypothetical protein